MPTTNIELVIGDWSGDGHEKTTTVNIKSNFSLTELRTAINSKEVKDVFDINSVCADYEERKLQPSVFDKLVELGILETEEEQDEFYVYTDVYVTLLLGVVKHFNPKFKYSVIENDSINIGGYGLFY